MCDQMWELRAGMFVSFKLNNIHNPCKMYTSMLTKIFWGDHCMHIP